jgi:hypothetical protein
MIPERVCRGTNEGPVEDLLRMPGVLALRVTVRPDAAGYAWCADASAGPDVATDRGTLRAATDASDTRALDALFAGGL